MKRIIIVLLSIILPIAFNNFIFASYNNEVFQEQLYGEVEQVFSKRSNIWNSLLAGQYISLEELEEELKTIVTGPQLEADIKTFKQILMEATFYEGICSMSIKEIHMVKNNLKKAELEVLIVWEVKGYLDTYKEEVKYIVEMKKGKENWLLSNYKIIG